MTIIHIGDGRHIELEVARRPPSPPKKAKEWSKRRIAPPNPHKIGPRPCITGENHWMNRYKNKSGMTEWWAYKNEIISKYRDSGKKVGEVFGVRRKKFGYIMGWVKRRVKKDMENIEKANPDLDDVAKEALEGALTVLRGPQSQALKLQAAKLLLDFTKAKPVSKSEVSVQNAEAWLASLGKGEE